MRQENNTVACHHCGIIQDWEVSSEESVEMGEHTYSGASVDTMMLLSPGELSFLRLTQD